jgi:hypothetical protein
MVKRLVNVILRLMLFLNTVVFFVVRLMKIIYGLVKLIAG